MFDERNDYGFPVLDKLEKARAYAAEAKERNKPGCECETCRMKEKEPGVIQLLQNWRTAGAI